MSETTAWRGRKWLVGALKLFVVVVVAWYIRGTIVDAWRQLGENPPQVNLWWMAVSGGLFLFGTLPCGLFWHKTLRALGQNVGLGQTLRAYYIGHLGKYVPGKAMVVVLRVGLIGGDEVKTSLVAASVFFETLTMMASGAMIAAALVAVWFRTEPLLMWAALGMMLATGVPVLPSVFRRLVRLIGVGRSAPPDGDGLAGLNFRLMALGWVLTGLGWVILGLSYWAVLRGLGIAESNPLVQLPLDTASVTLATVAGFLSFVPGGAVVREAVITELMIPHLGSATALLSAVLLRLAWLAAELVVSGFLYAFHRRSGAE